MTLLYSGVQVEIRDLILRDKPASMLAYSEKGTVPVLVLEDGTVLDESLDIIKWALAKNDPQAWLGAKISLLVTENDHAFKQHLDHYKYADRFPEFPAEEYRTHCEAFLRQLETRLNKSVFLDGAQCTLTDIAIFPFIRQFAFVDKDWFDQTPYPKLQAWLADFLDNEIFVRSMKKYQLWKEGDPITLFPD